MYFKKGEYNFKQAFYPFLKGKYQIKLNARRGNLKFM